MHEFTFTRVFIIQALTQKEFPSGTELKGYIDGLRENCPTVPPVDLVDVSSKEEFLAILTGLTSDCAQLNEQPILHIEAHGLTNQCGLCFPDGSKLDWLDLAGPLATLNQVSGFNLIVCVAACFGGHFLEGLKTGQASPCFGLIGPTHETNGPELLGSFRGLYRELLVNLDADAGLTALHAHRLGDGGFLTITAEEWFFKLVKGYLQRDCTRERLGERAAYLHDEIRAEGKTMPLGAVIQLGEQLARSYLDRSFETFFMTTHIPGNVQRFSESHEKAKSATTDFFASQGL